VRNESAIPLPGDGLESCGPPESPRPLTTLPATPFAADLAARTKPSALDPPVKIGISSDCLKGDIKDMNLVWALIITFWSYGSPYKTILYKTFPNDRGAYNRCMKEAQQINYYDGNPSDNQTTNAGRSTFRHRFLRRIETFSSFKVGPDWRFIRDDIDRWRLGPSGGLARPILNHRQSSST
jgi:hypothetical protein